MVPSVVLLNDLVFSFISESVWGCGICAGYPPFNLRTANELDNDDEKVESLYFVAHDTPPLVLSNRIFRRRPTADHSKRQKNRQLCDNLCYQVSRMTSTPCRCAQCLWRMMGARRTPGCDWENAITGFVVENCYVGDPVGSKREGGRTHLHHEMVLRGQSHRGIHHTYFFANPNRPY
jgi:hypothetical protein